MRKKVWKKIPGYSNFEASNDGEIRDIKNKSLIEFKKSYSGFGKYNSIILKNDIGRQTTEYVHRLVYSAFKGSVPSIEGKRIVVDHINNNKTDNRIENLQILTQSENMLKALSDGVRGDNLPIQVKDHKLNKTFTLFSMMEVSRYFKLPRCKIYKLLFKHKDNLFRDRYTFSIDEKNLVRVNRNRMAIKIYDHIKKIWLYPISRGHASILTGVDGGTISNQLKSKSDSVYGYTFRWLNDNSDIPSIPDVIAKKQRELLLNQNIDKNLILRDPIEIKDYVTNNIYIVPNYEKASEIIKVSVETVDKMIKNINIMHNGFCAKRITDNTQFKNYDKKYAISNAEKILIPITIIYDKNNKKRYDNLYDLGKKLNIVIRADMRLKNIRIILNYHKIKYQQVVTHENGCLTK